MRVDRRGKRLLEEGLDPAQARSKAEEEERAFEKHPRSSRPAPTLLTPRYDPPRPRPSLNPWALLTGCAMVAMLLPAVALVFFVLLSLFSGG